METQNSLQPSPLSALSDREIALAKIISLVNSVKQFPIPDETIIAWAKIITELRPWCSPAHLKRTIYQFVKGDLEWDNSKQIQNLMDGMLRIERID